MLPIIHNVHYIMMQIVSVNSVASYVCIDQIETLWQPWCSMKSYALYDLTYNTANSMLYALLKSTHLIL